MSTKEFNTHKDYPPGSFVLVHYRSGAPPSRLHTYWRGLMRVVNGENSRYTQFDLLTNKKRIGGECRLYDNTLWTKKNTVKCIRWTAF